MDTATQNALNSEINFQKKFGGFSPNKHLYRVRYDTHFDNTDPSQFGYIQDANLIIPLRFNQAKEQVLYTATNPGVAYKEIMKDYQDTFFYLSLWEKKDRYKSDINYYFVYTNKQTSECADSYRQIINNQYTNLGQNTADAQIVGTALELENTGKNQNYVLSSEIASEIFKHFGAILSVSQKSYGKELNVTFNKESADKYQINTIYHCRSLSQSEIDMFENNQTTLPNMYRVDMIGRLEGGKIKWYKYKININSMIEWPNHLFPQKKWFEDKVIGIEDVYMDVANSHDQIHFFTFNKDNKVYYFEANIELQPIGKFRNLINAFKDLFR